MILNVWLPDVLPSVGIVFVTIVLPHVDTWFREAMEECPIEVQEWGRRWYIVVSSIVWYYVSIVASFSLSTWIFAAFHDFIHPKNNKQ